MQYTANEQARSDAADAKAAEAENERLAIQAAKDCEADETCKIQQSTAAMLSEMQSELDTAKDVLRIPVELSKG